MANVDKTRGRDLLRKRGVAPYVLQGGADQLVNRWRAFVESVERGYTMGLDDYRNDLDIRTLLAAAGLSAEVADEDARLRSLLVNTRQAVWESDAPGAFWVCGYPRNAGAELLADLRAQGLAPSGRCAS